ncbi:MAG: dephospho-CoA kinase [Bacteroidales bacterium]|nr:dephospho-CoA kinase [Bacteroidales bacterium]
MRTVVISGRMGSGKSTLCRRLSEMGVPVYDSDSMAKSLYERSSSLKERVVEVFGPSILDSDGRIDRKALAKIVFADKDRLKALEGMVHPAVFEDFAAWSEQRPGESFVIFESAIFLDVQSPEPFADEIVWVDAPSELSALRASLRDSSTLQAVQERMAAQKDHKDDPRVTYIIENNGTPERLNREADKLYEYLKQKYDENRSR